MAGRGINITCEFEGDLLCLNVARHAPLYILIDELSEKTGVQAELQSIVLIDEHDETDSRLLDNTDIPLYHLGLRDGSHLILTALDDVADWQETEIVPVPKEAELTQDPMAEFFLLQPPAGSPRAAAPSSVSPTQAVHRRRLDTPIQPRRANHSFNGVMFDIKPNGPYEVMVSSMWVGGMMGSVTVWACDQAWCGDDNSQRVASSWGHGYHIVDQSHWEQIAARYCPPSWDIPAEIVFDHPVRIKPGQIRALYIHSALPDDLGIQYQSFRGADAITSDDIVTLLPGVGHTGPRPFNSGWYRGLRGLAGAISYTAMLRTWTPLTHHEAPLSMRAAAATLLLCHARKDCPISQMPKDIIFKVLECCDWHWFRDSIRRAPQGMMGTLADRLIGGGGSMVGGGQSTLGTFEQQQYEDPSRAGGIRAPDTKSLGREKKSCCVM